MNGREEQVFTCEEDDIEQDLDAFGYEGYGEEISGEEDELSEWGFEEAEDEVEKGMSTFKGWDEAIKTTGW